MRRPRRDLAPRRAPAVRLDAAALDGADDAPRWVQVAYEGKFEGHWQGPFEFTRATFETLIKNFRAHPSYRAGPDERGTADVIRFDFDHVSERDPTTGDVPVVGAPAQAWALDLEIRSGADGRAELWALTRYLEPARTYVKEGRYKWTSVSVLFSGSDPVTGADIGPVLTSIAFTNDPFLQGMVPITARAFGPYGEPVRTVADVLAGLRSIFALPETADLGALMGELGKLRTWATPGATAPAGVDVASLTAELRELFNLPTLSAPDAVFAEADKLLARLAEEQAAAAPPITTSRAPAPEPEPQDHAMGELDLKNLARRLKVKDTEEAVLLAIEQGQDAEQMLTSLLEALGVSDPQAAVAKVASLLKQAADLEQAMPELASLKDRVAKVEDEEANEEVDDAMAAHAMPASARVALLNLRRSDAKLFRETYPLPDPATRHLTQSLFTAPGTRPAGSPGPAAPSSSPLSRLQAGANGVRVGPAAPPPPLGSAELAIDLSAYAGANPVQRAMSYVRAQPGGDKLTFDEAHARACDLTRALRSAGRIT